MWRSISLLLALSVANPAKASGIIGYGSRAGMKVSVVSVEGLDTAHAVIRTKHTRENATAFCREYVLKVTDECIQQELAVPLNDVITANCLSGEFSDFHGNRYRFLGPKSGNYLAKYAIVNISTGAIADGSSASGYPTNMQIFRALCPTHAPYDQ
jgi:hypothetical protein